MGGSQPPEPITSALRPPPNLSWTFPRVTDALSNFGVQSRHAAEAIAKMQLAMQSQSRLHRPQQHITIDSYAMDTDSVDIQVTNTIEAKGQLKDWMEGVVKGVAKDLVETTVGQLLGKHPSLVIMDDPLCPQVSDPDEPPPRQKRRFVPREAKGGKHWMINGPRRPR